jgi:hypothetical protein
MPIWKPLISSLKVILVTHASYNSVIATAEQSNAHTEPLVKAHWHRCLGEALYNLGRSTVFFNLKQNIHFLQEAMSHLCIALQLLHISVPSGVKLRSKVKNEMIEQFVHRMLPANFLGTSSEPAKISLLLELGHIFYAMSRISLLGQNTLVNKYAIVRGLNLVERAGPSHELALFMASASLLFGHLDMNRTAETLSKQALTLSHNLAQKEKFHTLAYCSLPLAIYRISFGNFEEAEELLNQCVQLCWKIGDMRLLDECFMAKIVCFDFTGRCVQSAKLSNELLLSARSRGDQQLSEWATLIHCNALLASQRAEEAIKMMEDTEVKWSKRAVLNVLGMDEQICGKGRSGKNGDILLYFCAGTSSR